MSKRLESMDEGRARKAPADEHPIPTLSRAVPLGATRASCALIMAAGCITACAGGPRAKAPPRTPAAPVAVGDAEGADGTTLVALGDWAAAPAVCSLAPDQEQLRPETAYAAVQFLRRIVDAVRPGGSTASSVGFLDDIRSRAEAGKDVYVIPPAGFDNVLGVSPYLASWAKATTAVFDKRRPAFVVQMSIEGTRNNGPGQSPVFGFVETSLIQPASPYYGRFGVRSRFCAVPSGTGATSVFLDILTEY